MPTAVVLDTGVLSLVADRPGKRPEVGGAQNWLADLLTNGVQVFVPEICDYELRRELTRAGKRQSLTRLDALIAGTRYIPITTPLMRRAALLWAQVRNAGATKTDPREIDGDVILAAQALSLGYAHSDLAVATTNPGHLSHFLTASAWHAITP